MGKIVETGDEPPKSISTLTEHVKTLAERREGVTNVIKKYDEAQLWDKIKARDVPAEILEHVMERLEKGEEYVKIRRDLGIFRPSDKSWTKIMAALRAGYRIDGTAFLVQMGAKYKKLIDPIHNMIEKALTDGTPVLVKEGKEQRIEMMHGPTKELAGMIDAYNRLTQGFIKNGKDLGAFVEQTQGQTGGVTIVVQTNVPMPSQTEIRAHQEKKTITIPPEDMKNV